MTNKAVRTLTLSAYPGHFWVILAVWLLWNGLAATDYVMGALQGDAYYEGLSKAQVAYYKSVPLWAEAMHALSVWGGVLSAGLLIMRRKEAVWAVMSAFGGTAGYCFYVYLLSDGIMAMGGLWFMPALVCVLVAGLTFYVRALRRRGVLR